jgi:lipopolysaccharide biosynthesis glycosyltransferase
MYNLFFCTDENLIDVLPYLFKTFIKFNDPNKYIINFVLYDENKTLHEKIINIIQKISTELVINYKYFEPNSDFINLMEEYNNLLNSEWKGVTDKCVFCNFANWSRFYISDLYPNIDKGLYLDMDILFKNKIDKLFKTDISNKIVGVSPYETNIATLFTINKDILIKSFKKLDLNLNILKKKNYNCGVLYYNFELFKKNNVREKIFNFIKYQIKNNILITPTGTERNQNIIISDYARFSNKYNFIINRRLPVTNKDLKKIKILHFKGETNLIKNNLYLEKYNFIMNI